LTERNDKDKLGVEKVVMRVTCSHCGAEVTVASNAGEVKQRCGFCGGTVALPSQAAESAGLFRIYRVPIVVFVTVVFIGAVGIFALFVPEIKFRRAMEQGRAAEEAGQLKVAAEYYRLARDLRANGAGVNEVLSRVTTQLSQTAVTPAPQTSAPTPPLSQTAPTGPLSTSVAAPPMGIIHPLGKTSGSFPATYYALPSEPVILKLNSSVRPPVVLPVGTYATAQQARDFVAQHFAVKLGGDLSFEWQAPADPSSDKWWTDLCGEIPDRYTKATSDSLPQIYNTLARHFLIADYLLAHPEYAARRQGFGILLEVLIKASGKLEDKPLCVALADLVLAKLDCADPSQPSSIGMREAVERAVYAHRKFGDSGRMKLSFMRVIEVGDYYGNRNMSDFARLQLARACLNEGDREGARKYAEQIDPNSGIGGGKQEILRALDGAAQPRRRTR
jgi:ribosomal protein S27E/flagellar basal body-associated protein FliL